MGLPHRCSAADLEVDIRRMELPDDADQRYGQPIRDALKEMSALERGERINRDEDRAVGHYWLRDPHRWLDGKDDVAAAAKAVVAEQRRMDDFVEAVRGGTIAGSGGPFRKVLLVGIGGSALAPQLLNQAFRCPGLTPPLFVLDNTDPEGFERTIGDIRAAGGFGDTLTIVVSKSGGTKETRNGMLISRKAYQDDGLSFENHAVAITLPEKSALADIADGRTALPGATPTRWLDRFAVWDWVGGRTSLFAAVGLLPAALLGFDHAGLVAGARSMDNATRQPDLNTNPALLLATCWYHAVETRGLSNMVVLPYSDRLNLLGMYSQQLVMESLGKAGKGITVFGNKGSTDQHSFVQQLREGRADFFAMFVRSLVHGEGDVARFAVEDDITAGDYLAAFAEGTARALSEAGRPSLCITVDRIDEAALGAIVALLERSVGFFAAMIGINAYHQPGVEAGKRAADEYLVAQRRLIEIVHADRGKRFRAADLAERAGGVDEHCVDDILARLARNKRFGITIETDPTDGSRRFGGNA